MTTLLGALWACCALERPWQAYWAPPSGGSNAHISRLSARPYLGQVFTSATIDWTLFIQIFGDRKAIQDHFKYSVIFGDLLREAVSRTTAGECGIAFSYTHFPDLHVVLTKSAQSTDGSNGRDYCQAAILSLARSMQPSDAEIHASGIRRLEATSYWLAPRHVAIEVYADAWEALIHVYAPETLQHALLSVQPPELATVDPKNFLSWLEHQRASDARELIPLASCSTDRGEAVDNSSASQKTQSPTVAPSTIKLRLERPSNSDRGHCGGLCYSGSRPTPIDK